MSNGEHFPTAESTSGSCRFDRVCSFVAFAVTLLWFAIYARFAHGQLCDEPGHMVIIDHFSAHKPGWPDTMTTPPGYHLTVIALGLGHPTITTARATSTVFACLALAVFAAAWRRFHGRHPGLATLLVALLPVLQPFTAMAYSDAAGLAVILCAWWAQLAGRRVLVAILFAAACLVRQSNAVWGAFFIAFDLLRELHVRTFAAAIRRNLWLLLVIATGAAVVLATGRVTPGTHHGNQLQPNIATLHFAGVLGTFLFLPVWFLHRRFGARFWSWRWAVPMLAGATAAALAFANPHLWNRDLWWPDTRFTLLRNWPLVGIDTHPWLRAVSGLNLALLGAAIVVAFNLQRHRRALWLALAIGALIPATNSLVEPRYFITPAVFLIFFLEIDRRSFRALAIWFGVICAVQAPFIVLGRSLW